ncbi:MAG TPA: hypothetical protein VK196_14590 [Magnetospirillum sp.]|nr:hypothetical protein [Magnetospirillum sp.]
MPLKHTMVAASLVLAAAPLAQAQLVGNDGWGYSANNRGYHAQGQLLKRQAGGGGGGYGTTIINNSTTVGNIDQISQVLGDGATAEINTHTSQTSSGSQSSTATGSGALVQGGGGRK